MTVNDNADKLIITDKVIALIGARNGPVLADPDTAAVVLPWRGRPAAPYPFDPACLGPQD